MSKRLLVVLVALAGCGDDGAAADGGSSSSGAGSTTLAAETTTTTTGVDGTTSTAASSSDDGASESSSSGGPDAPVQLAPLCEDGLPFEYQRDDVGEPLLPTELSEATARYLDLLDQLRWFDYVDEHVHGWPQSDPRGRYWFGTWWSSVTVIKEGGEITYRHLDWGSDNNGLFSGPVLEGSCYAAALWPDDRRELLVRRMMRGMVSWIRAMEREVDDPDAPLLCRSFYPESVDVAEDGFAYRIDYDAARPGPDDDTSWYVHIPENPYWGDIYIKNKRSKDDIGHMLRAIAQVGACMPTMRDPETLADFEELRTVYAEWSRRVEDDGWRIYTLDKDANLWFWNDIAHYFIAAECASRLALRLLGHFEPGEVECGNGIGPLDDVIINATDHNGNIVRSFHEAAANMAVLSGHVEVAQALFDGLSARIVEGLDGLEGVAEPVPYLGEHDLVDMMTHGASIGVPLTSREVRYLHQRVDDALADLAAHPEYLPMLDVFDAATPDGEYAYAPWLDGIYFIGMGSLLGTCASPCSNPTSQPVLDCEMVAAHVPR